MSVWRPSYFYLSRFRLTPGSRSPIPTLPNLASRPCERRIGACAVTGGFIHLYSALDNRLSEKYGINPETSSCAAAAWRWRLASDEINFLYCNADANIVRIGTGADGKLLGSPLIGLPYVVLARRHQARRRSQRQEYRGDPAGRLSYRLAKEFLKKHNLSERDVTLATVGGTPTERYAALLQDVFRRR